MILKNGFTLIVLFVLVTGCTSSVKVPTINDSEVFRYENRYLSEYEAIKNSYPDTSVVKWIQPANKCVPCKVYVEVSQNNDRTLDENYKVFWDGGCKDGYANGIGREFERGTVLNREALAIYQGKKQVPQYYIQTNHLDNKIIEGDINNGFFVETTINDDNFNFNVEYSYGFSGSFEKPALVIQSSPFSDVVMYRKSYPNFHYQLYDFSYDEFQKTKYAFYMLDQNAQRNGFGFETPKGGFVNCGEFLNGSFSRLVKLPESYFTKANIIVLEITQAGQKAIDAQNYALKVKKQYVNEICKDSVRVTFIDDTEYKAICNECEYYAILKGKMDKKLAQINLQKQSKRDQLIQQELINNQIRQTNAAQRQADASQRSAFAAEQANSIQSWQNLNHNFQMQQLNNNLMFMRMGN